MSQFTVVVPYQFFFSKKSNSVKEKKSLILYAKLNETLLLNEVSCLKQGSEMTDFCLKQGKGLGLVWDHYTFLGNCPPTPPLSQHFALSEK